MEIGGYDILEEMRHEKYLKKMAKLYFFVSAHKKEYIESIRRVDNEISKIIKSQNKPIDEVINDIIKHRNHGI